MGGWSFFHRHHKKPVILLLCAGRGDGRQSPDVFPGLLCPAAAGSDGGTGSKVFLEINGIPGRVARLGRPAPGIMGASAKDNGFTHVGGTVWLPRQPDVHTLDKGDPGVFLRVAAWDATSGLNCKSAVEAPPPFRRRDGG